MSVAQALFTLFLTGWGYGLALSSARRGPLLGSGRHYAMADIWTSLVAMNGVGAWLWLMDGSWLGAVWLLSAGLAAGAAGSHLVLARR